MAQQPTIKRTAEESMALRIYNTLTRRKEDFIPRKKGKIEIYVCGPTVYDDPHIGHARSAYVFDVIVRYLKYSFKGRKVAFVRNITDIDDKIIEKARQLQFTLKDRQEKSLNALAKEVATNYTKAYHEAMDSLGLDTPDKEPKATEHIKDMRAIIKILIKKGYAYKSKSGVYFEVKKFVKKFNTYGRLSNRNTDELRGGARISAGEDKKDVLDFALWKRAKPDEPEYPGPWGKGRPGWHIECSAMSSKYFKGAFDIHGGGLDLIFPHHENEIAQSKAAGQKFAKYWMHNGLLTIDDQKMSKSLNNFVTVKDILKEYHPEVLKLLFLIGHYRSPVDFTYEKMKNIAEARKTFYEVFGRIDETLNLKAPLADGKAMISKQIKTVDEHKKKFMEAMDNDFNMPAASGYLYMIRNGVNRMIDNNKWDKKTLVECKEVLLELGDVLGLFRDKAEFKKRAILDKNYSEKIKERELARKNGDYKKADLIRQELQKEGIILKDTKTGTKWERKD